MKRGPKPRPDARRTQLRVKVSTLEHATLAQAAYRAGVTVSAHVRALLFGPRP